MRSSMLVAALLAVTSVFLEACEKIEDTDGDGDIDGDADADEATDSDSDVMEDAGEEAVTARVRVETSMGTFTLGLYGNAGPVTVENFLTYVDEGFYSGTVFHRVIEYFMIQGGGFNTSLIGPPTNPPIDLEIIPWLSHQPGVISMARTDDPNSATSQFFICVWENDFLDGDYAAFGIVEEGYDVVQAISHVETNVISPFENIPVTEVVINSMTRL